jgi:hypothetical protein
MSNTTPLSQEEYEQLKGFLGYFADTFMGAAAIDEEKRPVAFLQKLEQRSLTQAKRGLMMAIHDCLEVSSDWTPQKIAHVEEQLKARGLPSLIGLRKKYSKKYLAILKRGVIKTQEEYFMMKGVLDSSAIEAGAGETATLSKMVEEYEHR